MEKMKKPWVEKYRPYTLNDVYGQKHIVARLKRYVFRNDIPHLLFVGGAGIGKTTSALALIREVQEENMKENITYMELNASDARGIDVIREKVKAFASIVNISVPYKFIILDECDSMTKPAQQALRGIMEKYVETCRFILICNYSNKIIDPIQSRCSIQRFRPLTNEQIYERLMYISLKEGIDINEDGINAILYVANGDVRKSVNYLQAISSSTEKITKDLVYTISGFIHPDEIRDFIMETLNGNLEYAFEMITKFIRGYAISSGMIIKQMHREIYNLNTSEINKFKIISILPKYAHRLSIGSTEEVQLKAMAIEISEISQ